MITLHLRRALLENDPADLSALVGSLSGRYKSLVSALRATQTGILGVPIESAPRYQRTARLRPADDILDAEALTDGSSLFFLIIRPVRRRTLVLGGGVPQERAPGARELIIAYAGPDPTCPGLDELALAVQEVYGVTPEPYYYPASRFDELVAEGREPPPALTAPQLAGSFALADRSSRALATAIATSGGLLVRDVERTLQGEDRDRGAELTSSLAEAELLESEIVVICRKNQLAGGASAVSRSHDSNRVRWTKMCLWKAY